MPIIALNKAVSLHLGALQQPVVTRYELATLVYNFYRSKRFKGKPILVSKSAAETRDLLRVVKALLGQGVLSPDSNFPDHRVFRVLGNPHAQAEDIACTVDPFAFVSHLSAMDYHGLTDRLPTSLYLSSPNSDKWKELAFQRLRKDCGEFSDDYLQRGFPPLRRLDMKRIARRPIHRRRVKNHQGAYRNVQGRTFRVATIGRTFLDMVRDPSLCGGIAHVLDVFEEHAKSYLRLIVDEVNQWGGPIDKVRIGYILEDRCGVDRETTQPWQQFVQRGGSRKLDAKREYSSTFSERWSLSVNVIGA